MYYVDVRTSHRLIWTISLCLAPVGRSIFSTFGRCEVKEMLFWPDRHALFGICDWWRGGATCPRENSVYRDYPELKTKKDVRSFLGLAGYCQHFIPNFCGLFFPSIYMNGAPSLHLYWFWQKTFLLPFINGIYSGHSNRLIYQIGLATGGQQPARVIGYTKTSSSHMFTCLPSAAVEEWYSSKRPSSTVVESNYAR